MTETAMAKAWQKAATDLGFDFIAPYTFTDEQQRPHTCAGLLLHFGSPKGTLIVSRFDTDPDVETEGAKLGYFTSALSPRYETYQRGHFRRTLLDWGWYGPAEKRPSWFDDAAG